MDSSNINSNQEYTASSFFSYYREKRPEKFSDTVETYDIPLTKELFEQQMNFLSTQKKQSAFENFIVAVAQRKITPNIKPQTGPDGGGDGKVDAENIRSRMIFQISGTQAKIQQKVKNFGRLPLVVKNNGNQRLRVILRRLLGQKEDILALFFSLINL